MVYEGSSLTIMGLLTFDGEKLIMKDVVGFVAGGIIECKKYLAQRL